MVGVIIQARMGSSRVPGKTMHEIFGQPLLYSVLNDASWRNMLIR